jgi:hypothetical protein
MSVYECIVHLFLSPTIPPRSWQQLFEHASSTADLPILLRYCCRCQCLRYCCRCQCLHCCCRYPCNCRCSSSYLYHSCPSQGPTGEALGAALGAAPSCLPSCLPSPRLFYIPPCRPFLPSPLLPARLPPASLAAPPFVSPSSRRPHSFHSHSATPR